MDKLIAIIALLLGSIALKAQEKSDEWAVPIRKENFHVFLLMGQSNMSGFAPLESGDEKPIPRVIAIPTMVQKDFVWKPAAHPLHNRLPSDRFGLGLPFAVQYVRSRPKVTVGLIPVAWGGERIDNLNKGSPLYQDAIAKMRWAARQGVMKGVLWHQGESDTVTEGLAGTYAKKLEQLVSDLRQDLDDPNLPFIAGDLAEFYGTGPEHNASDRVAHIKKVRQALRDLPRRVPRTAFVESTGLRSADGHMVHFNRASYIEFGKRYASALDLLHNPRPRKFPANKDDVMHLRNRFIERELWREDDVWRTVRFSRTDGSDALEVESDEFNILLLDGKELTVDDYRARGKPVAVKEDGKQIIRIVYEPRHLLPAAAPRRVIVEYSLDNEPYLRKRLTLEMAEGQSIDRLEVERFSTTTRASRGGRGEPVFVGDAWFFGIEHPAGQTRHSNGFTRRRYEHIGNYSWVNLEGRDAEKRQRAGLITLMHFPTSTATIKSKSAVAGVGRKGDPLELAFWDYFETVRRPRRSFVHYNNWYDGSGKDLRPQNFAEKVTRVFQKNLAPYGVQMDAMCPDNGWQNNQSVWQPGRGHFPRAWDDFAALADAVEKENSHLGLWISANGCQLDIDWGLRNGYAEAQRSKDWQSYYRTFCIVQPQYRAEMLAVFEKLIKTGRLNYIKHDFNTQSCTGDGHGHLATDRHGHEASCDVMLDLFAKQRQWNPQIFQNVTNWTWFSPWWLAHCDTVWMLADDTAVSREWPQPAVAHMGISYRDSHLYHCWGNPEDRPLVPISALMTHGIVYASGANESAKSDSLQEWADYVTMYYARGVQLKELYITPSMMKTERWELLGRTTRWATQNAETLSKTVLIGGDANKGQPYGYVAWNGNRALVTLRNPDVREQTIVVPFDRSVFYRGEMGKPFRTRVIYPFVEEQSLRLTSGKPFSITIPSYTTLILELRAGAPTTTTVTPLPAAPVVLANGQTIEITIPDEAMPRCDLYLIAHNTLPTIALADQSLKSSRTTEGRNWKTASYDLRNWRGKTISLTVSVSGTNDNPFAASKTSFEAYLIADRPVKSNTKPVTSSEYLPWTIGNNYRRQSIVLQERTELTPAPRQPITDDQLAAIKAAKLRVAIFGSNAEPPYDKKMILISDKKLLTLPGNRGGDQWEEFVLDLPQEALARLRLTNTLRVTNSGDDRFKFKDLTLAVQLANGLWAQSTVQPKTMVSHADWAHAEGEPFQRTDESNPIELKFQ